MLPRATEKDRPSGLGGHEALLDRYVKLGVQRLGYAVQRVDCAGTSQGDSMADRGPYFSFSVVLPCRIKKLLTLFSQFDTDKRVDLRYNTLCIYMWTYALEAGREQVFPKKGEKGGPSWKKAHSIMCPSWSGK